jgi:uncharacterized protein
MTNRLYDRDALDVLERWRDMSGRKPLVIRGARQVGKSCLVGMFAASYRRRAMLNLEKNRHAELFRQGLDLDDLIQAILLECSVPPGDEPLLLFLDEVQEVPAAVAMLRFFMEERPDIHVIAAGSLLELAIHAANISFPVGRVQYLYLRPFTFREFLGALQESSALEALSRIPVPEYAHSKLLRLFHAYTCVGGMPEAVRAYVESERDLSSANLVCSDLMAAFRDDIGKYGRNETLKRVLLHVLDTAPRFAGSRIKFHGFGGSNYRSREVGEAFRTLERAMILDLVYPTTDIQEPMQASLRKSPRLQFLDAGLVSHLSGIQSELLAAQDLSSRHRGCIMEQVLGQEIKARDLRTDTPLSFWVREKAQASAEVDFLIKTQRGVVPVETKAGATGKLRSLHQFMQRSKKQLAVRLYAGTPSRQNVDLPDHSYTLLNIPYYAASLLESYVGATDEVWND